MTILPIDAFIALRVNLSQVNAGPRTQSDACHASRHIRATSPSTTLPTRLARSLGLTGSPSETVPWPLPYCRVRDRQPPDPQGLQHRSDEVAPPHGTPGWPPRPVLA